jgi:hypothetical protein
MKIVLFLIISIGVAVLATPFAGYYAFPIGLLCLVLLRAFFGG